MNRDSFYKLCESADKELDGDAIGLEVGVSIDRGFERAVYLHGCWSGGCIVQRELYRPTPGRQSKDCYRTANTRCHAALEKFERWLDDYKGGVLR